MVFSRYDECDPLSPISVNAHDRLLVFTQSPMAKRRWRGLVFGGAAGLVVLLLLVGVFWRRLLHPGRSSHVVANSVRSLPVTSWTDRFGDGTPDFLRLGDPADQAAFRRWFTLIAEYHAIRPKAEVPVEITDCASLLRYSYREALKRHDENWFTTSGMEIAAPPGEVRAWSYPHTPLGSLLFRVRPGAFDAQDLNDGAFAQFADAKTLVERNAYLVSRDVWQALPGDLLFYRQFGQSSPWHSMIVTRGGAAAEVVYDTGPDHGAPGEIRRVLLSELLDHPQPQWRPTPGNPNFLGVYRWNILRGTP